MVLKKAWEWFLEAMFPPKCLICRKEGQFLCTKHHKFQPAPPSRVRFQYLDEIFATVAYDDLVCKKLVEFYKFRGISDLAEIMATAIVHQHQNILKNSILVPIPLHWTRKIWRSFNQSEILAKKIAEKLPSVKSREILKRIKKTRQQARLSKKERERNTDNAFAVHSNLNNLKNKPIILVDDVVASGATLEAAAKTLKLAGFKNVKAVVFARGGK